MLTDTLQVDGSQTATPEAQQQKPVTADDLAKLQQNLNELNAKNAEIEGRLAEKDKYITELSTTKATLEARLKGVSKEPEVDTDLEAQLTKVMETAQVDPAAAAKEQARIINTYVKRANEKTANEVIGNLRPAMEQENYIAEIRTKNKDLIDAGLEDAVALSANKKMAAGKPFKFAIDEAVKDMREKLKVLIPTPETSKPVTPQGAQGLTDANVEPPAPPVAKEETQEDEIKKRQEERRKKGL